MSAQNSRRDKDKGEKTPLIGEDGKQGSFYFLSQRAPSLIEGQSREESGEGRRVQSYSNPSISDRMGTHRERANLSMVGSLVAPIKKLFGMNEDTTTRPKPRKVPIKVEPKVFFANERTFLSWMHMAVTLASIAVAIIAFADANEWSQIYGLVLMPIAIALCVYSFLTYTKRAFMIRRKEPGPYEDKFGPSMLAVLLAIAIAANFCMKLMEFYDAEVAKQSIH
jgi:uncharacterized membrane protein YidH (DUF202 family)